MSENKPLGNDGAHIGRLGNGAMGLEGYYGASEDESAIRTLCHAIDSGMMIDSADAYGNGHNEELVGQAIRQCTADPFVAQSSGSSLTIVGIAASWRPGGDSR